MRRVLLPLLIAAVATPAVPAAASAATVALSGTEVLATAGPEVNDIGVGSFAQSADLQFTDARGPLPGAR